MKPKMKPPLRFGDNSFYLLKSWILALDRDGLVSRGSAAEVNLLNTSRQSLVLNNIIDRKLVLQLVSNNY